MQLKRWLPAVLGMACILQGISQVTSLSNISRISVVTCGSGDDLYTTFGHSAFRVLDPSTGLDVIYNYGTFDFDPPGFYVEFAMGKLLYKLSKQSMDRFLLEYRSENRWVKEQILDLDWEERQQLYSFLERNYLPENRTYQYDFFHNNCATKIWDVLKDVYGDQLQLEADYLKERYTFRQLIHQHLDTNSWAAFGIDLALGAVIDHKASPKEHMFLPHYVMEQLKQAKKEQIPLAFQDKILLQNLPIPVKSDFFKKPLFWILTVMAIVLLVTLWDFRKHKRSRWLDATLFGVTGLSGCLLFFLWFLTDHTATAANLNLLWAFPLNLAVVFFLSQKTPAPWLAPYLKLMMVLLGAMLLLAFVKVQVFSPLLWPIWLALALRYWYLTLHFKTQRILQK